MDFVIEKPKPEDAEGIRNVFDITWLATYPNEEKGIYLEDIQERINKKREEGGVEKQRKQILESKEDEILLVAKNSGEVIGVCRVIKKEDRNQLQAIYVLPDFQGKGVGKLLWSKAIEFTDHTKDTYVEVVDYNQGAINFYKNIGFTDTGRRFQDERFRMKSGAIFTEMEMVKKAES